MPKKLNISGLVIECPDCKYDVKIYSDNISVRVDELSETLTVVAPCKCGKNHDFVFDLTLDPLELSKHKSRKVSKI